MIFVNWIKSSVLFVVLLLSEYTTLYSILKVFNKYLLMNEILNILNLCEKTCLVQVEIEII